MDRALVELLRDDLARADYTVDRLRELWGEMADAALDRSDRVPARRVLATSDDRAALIARLFLLGDPLDERSAARALPRIGVDGAKALGLVERSAGEVRGTIDLRPYSVVDGLGVVAWWIASDLGEISTGVPLREDHVLGVGGASTTLAALQLPDPSEQTLDLGTGCGIQALHASRYSGRVIATDVSARALSFAELTAALCGVERIEFRLGGLLEPVADERFDRIVSNPPFVITPRTAGVPEYTYRDAGLRGDELLPSLVGDLRTCLAPGGIAQLLGNWEYRDSADGLAAIARAAEDAGLEYWIVERDRLDPARYAETWIRDGGTRRGGVEWERLVDAWLTDFAQRNVDEIGFGYLLLRAAGDPDAVPLRRAERLSERIGENPAGLGAHLAAALHARDRVVALDDPALLGLRLGVSPDVSEERSHRPGEEHPSVITLRQGGGFGRSVRCDPALAAVIGACDGELPVGVIIDAVAELLEVDGSALRARVLPELRELVIAGLVVP